MCCLPGRWSGKSIPDKVLLQTQEMQNELAGKNHKVRKVFTCDF